jgi:uncharacterized protein
MAPRRWRAPSGRSFLLVSVADAGDFSAWITGMQAALRGERASDVPCAGCTACCTSSQFVPIGPDETETLARIPAALLFRAPRRPRGHVVLGYDERGHCPMLIDGRCSIYEHRPRACRTYDCRVFPAAGVEVAGGPQVEIARRARQWRFRYPTDADQVSHDAVRAAVAFLEQDPSVVPGGAAMTSTQIAVLAVEIHHVFLGLDIETGVVTVVDPSNEAVRAEVQRYL